MKNLVGNIYGRWTVLRFSHRNGKNYYWECQCSCDKHTVKTIQNPSSMRSQSCGCLSSEAKTIHGLDGNPIYHVFNSMRFRCYNKKSESYKNYGGRGIAICDTWLNDVTSFVSWANETGYKKGLTIERIDVNGNYCPENCKWATTLEQSYNRRDNVWIEYDGETKTLCQWADCFGIRRSTLCHRLYAQHLTINEALNKPVRKQGQTTIPKGSTPSIDTMVEAVN